MKKIICFLLTIISCVTLIACDKKPGGEKENMKFKGEPIYSGNEEMLISGYWSPRPIDEQFKWVKEAGFTHIYLEGKYGAHGTKEFEKSLDLCEKYGIKVISQRYDYKAPAMNDPQDYSKYTCFSGHNIWDEPSKADMSIIAADLVQFKEKYKDNKNVVFYSNLFPNYATSAQTGYATFEEYVEGYCKTVIKDIPNKKTLSCDSYPLKRDESRKINYIKSGHLNTLNTISRMAYKYGAEPYFFIQDMDFGVGNRAPSENDFFMQTYACFAFGIRGIQHFTYMTPNDSAGGEFGETQTGLIDRQNNKTERWEYAKKLNEMIAKFDNVYLSFNWKGVMTTRGTEEETACGDDFLSLKGKLEKHDRIKSFTSQRDTILGTFKDAKDYDGFMVMPYRDATDGKTTDVEIVFNNADSAVVYIDGEKSIISLDNGVFKATINAGRGIFVIPFNK